MITIDLNKTLVPLPKNVSRMKKEEKIYYIREMTVKYKLAKEVRYKKNLLLKHFGVETSTLPPEMFGAFGSVWCKMALGEVGVSLP